MPSFWIWKTWIDLQDPRGLMRSARLAKQLGSQGKMAIHPTQIEPINAAFLPTVAEITLVTRVVEAFNQAEAEDMATIQLDGQFIDYPIVEAAQCQLAVTEALEQRRIAESAAVGLKSQGARQIPGRYRGSV
jgi:citrate lyase subunit beta/citryl-CoA lyase